MYKASHRLAKIMALLLLIAAALILYAHFDPEDGGLFPRCIFLQLTGFKCPGCGSQRALHQLLHGNLAAAFHYNAFLVILLPYLFLSLLLYFLSKGTVIPAAAPPAIPKAAQRLFGISSLAQTLLRILCGIPVLCTILVLAILFCIFRNIYAF